MAALVCCLTQYFVELSFAKKKRISACAWSKLCNTHQLLFQPLVYETVCASSYVISHEYLVILIVNQKCVFSEYVFYVKPSAKVSELQAKILFISD